MARHTYSPKLKAQVILEVLSGEKTPAHVAKAYGAHPNSVQLWKRRFLERAPEIFAGDEVLTTAILDRLLHHVHIVHIDGQSYQLREISQLLRPESVAASAHPRKEVPAKSA